MAPAAALGGRWLTDEDLRVDSAEYAGANDWGVHQRAGRLERMQPTACTQMRGVHLRQGAGHWIQREQPDAVTALRIEFLQEGRRRAYFGSPIVEPQ